MALISSDGYEDQEQIRALLDDHIRSVTALIQRLNKDIQVGCRQYRVIQVGGLLWSFDPT